MNKQQTVQLSAEEAKAILAIENGADVYAYGLASTLREMQRRGIPVQDTKGGKQQAVVGPLFRICDVRNYCGDGTDQVPYFGAIATPIGIKIARAVLAGIEANTMRGAA